ncbi:hypothetical protein ACK2GQ_22485 [Clostridioides difficile]
MLKKLKKMLLITCCLFMMSSTAFAETQNSEGKSFTISGSHLCMKMPQK